MVLVFKTSVEHSDQVERLQPILNQFVHPGGRWSFDLTDCDKVLRMEHHSLDIENVISAMHDAGFECCELEG